MLLIKLGAMSGNEPNTGSELQVVGEIGVFPVLSDDLIEQGSFLEPSLL